MPGFLEALTAATAKPRMRRALFVGINYTGSQHQLNGCLQDVRNMSAFVQQRFPHLRSEAAAVRVLADTPENSGGPDWPSRENVLAAMRWLVADARAGDHFFFHYSGHGCQVKDTDGDEVDGMDEAILPVDYTTAGVITDDLMHSIMCASLPWGSFMTALFDCCHS
ncbi:Ca(2+)-dependent cysteine protease, partial [Cladochytrium tenue]